MPNVLNKLNVSLAYRLGDPADTEGVYITPSNLPRDGVAFTNIFREDMLREALIIYLDTLGHSFSLEKGFPGNYLKIKDEELPSGSETFTLPTDCARVLHVDYYGRPALVETWKILSRKHHMYWQKTPTYFPYLENLEYKMRFSSPRTDVTNITIYYIRKVGDLRHDGAEDIDLDPYHHPYILSLAEALARRNHQQLGPSLANLAGGQVQTIKETM